MASSIPTQMCYICTTSLSMSFGCPTGNISYIHDWTCKIRVEIWVVASMISWNPDRTGSRSIRLCWRGYLRRPATHWTLWLQLTGCLLHRVATCLLWHMCNTSFSAALSARASPPACTPVSVLTYKHLESKAWA